MLWVLITIAAADTAGYMLWVLITIAAADTAGPFTPCRGIIHARTVLSRGNKYSYSIYYTPNRIKSITSNSFFPKKSTLPGPSEIPSLQKVAAGKWGMTCILLHRRVEAIPGYPHDEIFWWEHFVRNIFSDRKSTLLICCFIFGWTMSTLMYNNCRKMSQKTMKIWHLSCNILY